MIKFFKKFILSLFVCLFLLTFVSCINFQKDALYVKNKISCIKIKKNQYKLQHKLYNSILNLKLAGQDCNKILKKTIQKIQNKKDDDNTQKVEDELSDDINDMLDSLDMTQLDEMLSKLNEQQMVVFGKDSIKNKLESIVKGDTAVNYNNLFSYVFSYIGGNIFMYLPIIMSIFAITLGLNMVTSIKGKFASASIQNIAYLACVTLITIILLSQIMNFISSAKNIIQGIKTQTDIVFPIILTLMTAIGATSSVNIYQPSVILFSNSLINLILLVAFPIFITSFVLSIVGNLSDKIKLNKMSEFFSGLSKWFLGTTFFIFIAFLSIQGITASIYDGISIRTAKFAISKYVPIIGGYLSEGFNLVMAGSVLIKNSIGLTCVILLFLTVLPLLINMIIFLLSIKLSAAIVEPMGEARLSKMLTSVSKQITVVIVMTLSATFLYFIFLVLFICTGNLVL